MSFPLKSPDKMPELPIKNKRIEQDNNHFTKLKAPNKYKRMKDVVKVTPEPEVPKLWRWNMSNKGPKDQRGDKLKPLFDSFHEVGAK